MFLATLDAILRRGSFAAAAEEVGLTPSAVSLQVKRLEEHLGQPLFVRSARTAQPTPVVEGRVVVGTIRTVQSSTLPTTLLEVHRGYPKLVVRALQGASDSLVQQLKTGVIDAAVVIKPASAGGGRLRWHPLAREPLVLIAPQDSHGDSLTELLRRHDWVQFDTETVSGRIAANYLRRLAPRARGSVEVDSIDTIVALVSAGAGISVVPKPRHPISTVHPVREIKLGKGAPFREIAFVSRELDVDNRRVLALREAFEFAYGASAAAE